MSMIRFTVRGTKAQLVYNARRYLACARRWRERGERQAAALYQNKSCKCLYAALRQK